MPEAQKPDPSAGGKKPAPDAADKASADAKAAAQATKEVEAATKAAEAAEAATKAAEDAEAAAKAAIAKAEAAKAEAEAATKAAIDAEYKAIADKIKSDAAATAHTFKRQSEEIFRREMDEPEFFLHKKDRFPIPILSQEQQAELTRKVEIPVDNTPKYVPERVLSPEYGGMSNYESGVGDFLEESRERLARLKNDPEATQKELAAARHDVSYLESLYENYFLGMNVFRTAKGGRSKLQKK